jgi:hypothetical protein
VDALRRIGVRVKVTSSAGDGLTDLLMFYRGQTLIGEIKRDDDQELTPAQAELHALALEAGVVIPIFTSVDNALLFFGAQSQ